MALTACGLFSAVSQASPLLGVDGDGRIWSSDPVAKKDTLVFDSNRDFSNGLAYDAVNNRIFYSDGTGGAGGQGPQFYVYDVNTKTETRIDVQGTPYGGTWGSLPAAVESGSFYNGSYWYVQEGQDSLYRVQFDFSNTAAPFVTNVTEFNDFDDNGGPERLDAFDGGDIAINNSGLLFLSSHNDQYGKLNITGSPGTPGAYTQVRVDNGGSINIDGVQLAYDLNTGVLYGHSYSSGTWYTVDQTTGILTSTGYTSANRFFDTASGPFVPEPSTFALAGVASLAFGIWYWRKRKKPRDVSPAVAS